MLGSRRFSGLLAVGSEVGSAADDSVASAVGSAVGWQWARQWTKQQAQQWAHEWGSSGLGSVAAVGSAVALTVGTGVVSAVALWLIK